MGRLPAPPDSALALLAALGPEEVGSAGALLGAGDPGRTPEPLALLAGDAALLVASPASGNLQLFRRGCGWAERSPCLAGQRFEVVVDWHDEAGAAHPAQVSPVGSDNAQIFTFFAPGNWEMMVKVLDGCGLNERFWVFAAASTDVAFDIRVRDSYSGATKVYSAKPARRRRRSPTSRPSPPAARPLPTATPIRGAAAAGRAGPGGDRAPGGGVSMIGAGTRSVRRWRRCPGVEATSMGGGC